MMGSRVRVTQAAPKFTEKSCTCERSSAQDKVVDKLTEPGRNQGTPRRPMSTKRRQHIFSEHCTGHNVAPCCLCGKPIHRHNDQWTIEHMRALGLLGADLNTNCAPVHEACRREKDKTDLARIAKAKRQAAAGTPRYVHDTHTPETKKPARGFQAPAGVKYDWRQRRYVKAERAKNYLTDE